MNPKYSCQGYRPSSNLILLARFERLKLNVAPHRLLARRADNRAAATIISCSDQRLLVLLFLATAFFQLF